METRIYGIDLENYEFDTHPETWDSEKFMAEAEIQGNVWSLKGFEADFNNDYLNQSNLFIKFVENEK